MELSALLAVQERVVSILQENEVQEQKHGTGISEMERRATKKTQELTRIKLVNTL
jgi:hypothetical protein